jgi:hypothetical protein
MRYYFTSVRMTKINKTDKTIIVENEKIPEPSYNSSDNVKWYSHSESNLAVPQKGN